VDESKKLERLYRYLSCRAVSGRRLSLTANRNLRFQWIGGLLCPCLQPAAMVDLGVRTAQITRLVCYRERTFPFGLYGAREAASRECMLQRGQGAYIPRQFGAGECGF
jgi:hypothetical protein